MKTKLLSVLFITLLSSASIAQWSNISLPLWGGIRDLHFIGNDGYVISGYENLGTAAKLYKTTNHGQNWIEISPNYMSVISPPGVNDWSDYGSSITVTFTGEGVHFFDSQEGLISLTVLVEVNDFPPTGTSFATTLKTTNSGTTWTEVQQTTDATGFTQFIGLNDSSAIIHRHGDIFRTYDKGDTWTEIFDYSYGWNFDFDHIVLGPDDRLYAGVHVGSNNNEGQTMVSDDDGTSWTEIFDNFPTFSYRPDIAFSPTNDVMMVSILSAGPASQTHTYSSTNGGVSWNQSTVGVSKFEHASGKWLALGGPGVIESNDGVQWNTSLTPAAGLSDIQSYNNEAYVWGWDGLMYTTFDISTAGIEEADQVSINLFPNPITGAGTVQATWENVTGLAEWNLTDLSGKIISNGKTFESEESIDIDLPSGIYFFQLTSNNSSISKKLIVQ